MSFADRVARLPRLGTGLSTEFGAAATGLDPLALHRRAPDRVRFLEVGADLARGVDGSTTAWVAAGLPTTWHFLDINLEDPSDRDPAWAAETAAQARAIGAAWLCGDAGRWRVGPRDRAQGLLLPPILCDTSAQQVADSVRWLREATGFEVLPENPPGNLFLGDLSVPDYFARVADAADCGLLLDVAHLAIAQRAQGRAPLDGLDNFPLDRVVEVHVAGGRPFVHAGRAFVADDHGPHPLPDTWEIFRYVVERAGQLRAVVVECERNPVEAVLPLFDAVAAVWR